MASEQGIYMNICWKSRLNSNNRAHGDISYERKDVSYVVTETIPGNLIGSGLIFRVFN